MSAFLPQRSALIALVAITTALPEASAQTFIGASFQQAFTSADALESPRGIGVVIGVDRVWGPVGGSVGYQHVAEGSGRVAQTCGFASCTDQSHSLRTVEMSLSLLLVENANVIFVVEANSSLSRQAERLEHVDTGEVRRDGAGPDLGFGVAARLQLPLLRSLRPFLTARYDRITRGTCDQDASCFGGRHVGRLGVGLAWLP